MQVMHERITHGEYATCSHCSLHIQQYYAVRIQGSTLAWTIILCKSCLGDLVHKSVAALTSEVC